MTTPTTDRTAELMLLGQIHGIVWGLRYMGHVGTQDNLVRRRVDTLASASQR